MSTITSLENVLGSMSARQLRAVRRLRNGVDISAACSSLRVEPENVRILETVFRDVPDRILSDIEQLLSDHVRLQRLIAAIPRSLSITSEKSANAPVLRE